MDLRRQSSSRQSVQLDLLFGARAIGSALKVPQSVVLRLAQSPKSPIFKSGGRLAVSSIQIKSWLGENPELFAEITDTLYTIRDIARFLMTNEDTVRRLIRDKGLPVVRVGKTNQASKKRLAEWVKKATEVPKDANRYRQAVDTVGREG